MKIFISMGFKKRTEEEVLKRMEELKQEIKQILKMVDSPIEFIDNYHKTIPDDLYFDSQKSVYCLGDSIKLMASADMVVFDRDWDNHRGCTIEHMICEFYNLTYFHINSDVS